MDDTKYAAFVGIDWADEEHAVCLAEADGDRYEEFRLPQTAEAIDEWAGQVRQRFGNQPVAVCLEQSRGALIYALMKYDFLVLFPLNPKQLAKYREALSPSGAKDDPSDARLLADFVKRYHARLRCWRPDDTATRTIRLLVEGRRHIVDDRTRLGNRLQQQLKQYFPLALQLSHAIYANWFLRLLEKFSHHKALQRAAPRTLERMLPKLRRTSENSSDPRIAQIRQAQPLVTDTALIAAGQLQVQHLVRQLREINRAIAEYDQQLAKMMAEHPDAQLFESLPGAGAALAPRLLAAFGSDRDRYAAATEIQQQSGIAPVTRRSGKTTIVQRRRACPKFLRQTFHEFAGHSLKGSRWAVAYYHMLRQKGKGHHPAVRSLAFKWIRILFRCWKNRVRYDESRYLQRLRHKNASLLVHLNAIPNASTTP
jgi:transposase